MRRLWKLSLAIFFFAPLGFPCSCSGPGGCAALGTTKNPVFLGTVLAVTGVPQSQSADADWAPRKARIRVNETFGGLTPGTREVDVMTGYGNGDCGVPFEAGDVYLVDANAGEDGVLSAWICSNTTKVEKADVLLRLLRQRRDGRQLPSLIGQIVQTAPDFKSRYGQEDPQPLAGAPIRLRHSQKNYETRSDSSGVYAFYDLPSGKYQMDADLPSGMTRSWNSDHDGAPLSLELNSGRCKQEGIEVYPGGSIQGRVLDSSDKPLHDVPVYIVPARQQLSPQENGLVSEFQGKEGFFKFIHLPPGEYLILVNPADRQDPAFPFPLTFAPAVRDRESAGIITVRAGEHVADADIHVTRLFEPRPLTVRVAWADGRLIRGFVFVEGKQMDHPEALATTEQPDLGKSIIHMLLVPGKRYEIEATLICRYSYGQILSAPGATLHTDQIDFEPSDDRTEISLTMPGNACPALPGKTLLSDQ